MIKELFSAIAEKTLDVRFNWNLTTRAEDRKVISQYSDEQLYSALIGESEKVSNQWRDEKMADLSLFNRCMEVFEERARQGTLRYPHLINLGQSFGRTYGYEWREDPITYARSAVQYHKSQPRAWASMSGTAFTPR